MSVFLLQSMAPVNAQTVHYVSGTDSGLLDGKAIVKTIGPLSVPDGDVVFAQDKIVVLSDTDDPVSEAELSGRIFNVHITGTDSLPTASGIALFLKGYSLSSLDDPKIEETIKLRDGTTVTGRIADAGDDALQINVATTKKRVSFKDIADVSSPRCFSFSLPATAATATTATAPKSAAKPSLVSFRSNYVAPPPSIGTLLPTTAMLEGQLTQHHMSKKLLEYSAGLAFLSGCFALPIVLAISTTHLNPSDVAKITKIVKVNVKEGKLDNKTK
jgi:hypothetical protein